MKASKNKDLEKKDSNEKLPLLAEKFKIGKDHDKAKREYRKTGKNKLYK